MGFFFKSRHRFGLCMNFLYTQTLECCCTWTTAVCRVQTAVLQDSVRARLFTRRGGRFGLWHRSDRQRRIRRQHPERCVYASAQHAQLQLPMVNRTHEFESRPSRPGALPSYMPSLPSVQSYTARQLYVCTSHPMAGSTGVHLETAMPPLPLNLSKCCQMSCWGAVLART